MAIAHTLTERIQGGVKMSTLKQRLAAPVVGLSMLGLSSGGCGTITGAALGGATGAGIGAATHHRVERSAIIGAGVGAAAGAAYDIYRYSRRNNDWRRDSYHDYE